MIVIGGEALVDLVDEKGALRGWPLETVPLPFTGIVIGIVVAAVSGVTGRDAVSLSNL